MAAKGNAFITDYLKLMLNNTNIANLGDATGVRGSSTAGSVYVALHTASPGAAGDQTTNEISYTSYARVAVARSSGGWTVTSQSVAPAADVVFPASTGGTGGTATHASIGFASSGASEMIYFGALSPNIVVISGVTPRVTAAASTITES